MSNDGNNSSSSSNNNKEDDDDFERPHLLLPGETGVSFSI